LFVRLAWLRKLLAPGKNHRNNGGTANLSKNGRTVMICNASPEGLFFLTGIIGNTLSTPPNSTETLFPYMHIAKALSSVLISLIWLAALAQMTTVHVLDGNFPLKQPIEMGG